MAECLICGGKFVGQTDKPVVRSDMSKGFFGVCSSCRAKIDAYDAILTMPNNRGLIKREGKFFLANMVNVCNLSGMQPTPEAALTAAGLMEEKP